MATVQRRHSLLPARNYLPVLLACGVSIACAQNRPTVSPDGGAVQNPFDFPIEVLVVHAAGSSIDAHSAVAVDPHASAPLRLPSGSQLETLVPLDPTRPFNALPACPGDAGSIRLTPALVHAQMSRADEEGVASGTSRKLEDIAQKEGAIDLEQWLDEAHVRRNDPVAAELRSEQFRDADPATRAQMIQQDKNDQIGSMVETAVYYAAANGEVMQQHDANAEQEAQKLTSVLEQKQQDLKRLQDAYAATNVHIAAEREFNERSAAEIVRRFGTNAVPPALPGGTQVGRPCGGAANDQDIVAIIASGATDAVLFTARADFDRGGSESLVFRQISGTPQWISTMYWPLEATRAAVSVTSGTHVHKLGVVQPGRSSVLQQLVAAQKAVQSLKSRTKTVKFSSEGGDESKTTIIP